LLRVLKLEQVWVSLGVRYDGEGLRYLKVLVVKEVRVWDRRPINNLHALNEDIAAVVSEKDRSMMTMKDLVSLFPAGKWKSEIT
jgi:hypothetical protein